MGLIERPEPDAPASAWREYARFLGDECQRQAQIGNGAMIEADQMRRTAVRHAQDAASAHEQLRGAVEERDRLRSFVADFLAWRTTADLNRLAGEARDLSDQWGQ